MNDMRKTWYKGEHFQHPRCEAYTWYDYHWDYNWEVQCVGRSDFYDIMYYEGYGYSAERSLGAGPYGRQ